MTSINNVSDTALWIAAYRARESEREDAVFKDALAKKLAGERGFEMADSTPGTKAMAFVTVIRTSAIDRLVMNAIKEGVDTVINLGAGLDTRPYRMQLPAQLQWIEIDLQNIIDYKTKMLQHDKPSCILKRIVLDLSNETERENVFKNINDTSKKALVITEGVIPYLKKEQALNISKSLVAYPSFKYWIMDFKQGRMRSWRVKKLKKHLKKTPLQFDDPDPIKFFGETGWRVKEKIFILDEADRINRELPVMFPWSILMKLFRKKIRNIGNKTHGSVMFEH
jgi:methyltransferase (TIGR00027 family)